MPGSVLIVDDDAQVLESVAEFLEARLEVQVLAVSTLADARRALAENRFDVVISDYRLGGTEDGVDFLRAVARGYPSTKRIAMTGSADEYIRQAGRADGYAVLSKPVNPELLAKMVQALLPK